MTAWSILAVPVWTENKKSSDGTVSIFKFIPGVSQLKSKKYVKGTLLLGSFVGSITGTFIYNNRGNHWYEQYKNSVNPEEIVLFRRYTEKSFRKRNLCIAGIFGVFILHLLDLKFFKSKKTIISGQVSGNGLTIGIYHAL